MNIKKTFITLVCTFAILLPEVAHAKDIVYYDDSNVDQVLIDNNMVSEKLEKEVKADDLIKDLEVRETKDKDHLEKNEVAEKIEEEVADIKTENIKDQTPNNNEALLPKTEVYDKVVDMSEYQTPTKIDYDYLSSNIDGAILRSSITEKNKKLSKDKAVDIHYNNLNSRDIPIGFYHYSRAVNEKDAIKEANFVLSIIKNKKVSLPVYIDIEDHDIQLNHSREDISKAANAFTTTLRRNGYVSGIYSYPWFADKYLSKKVREDNEFWIADWASKDYPSYNSTDFDSWQYSSKGGVLGYNYDIDKNVLYKDYPLIMTGVSKKGLDTIADEVIMGKWGVGNDRRLRLTYAGYDYNIIQNLVNLKLKIA